MNLKRFITRYVLVAFGLIVSVPMICSAQNKNQLSKSCDKIVRQGGEVLDYSEGQRWIIYKKKHLQKKTSDVGARSLYTLGVYDVASGKTTVLSDDNCVFVDKSPSSKSGNVRITKGYAWDCEDGVLADAAFVEDVIMRDEKMLVSLPTGEDGTIKGSITIFPLGKSKAKKKEIALVKSTYSLTGSRQLTGKGGNTYSERIWTEDFDVDPLRKVTIESASTFSYYRNVDMVFDGETLVSAKCQRVICNTDGEIVETGRVMTLQEALMPLNHSDKQDGGKNPFDLK